MVSITLNYTLYIVYSIETFFFFRGNFDQSQNSNISQVGL